MSFNNNRRLDLLDRLWRIGSAGRTTAALLGLVAGALVVVLVFPQQPAGLNRAAAETWLTETAAHYREIGVALRSLGFFTVSDGWLLRLLLALLAFNLLLRLAAGAERAGRTWRSAADKGRSRLAVLGPPLLCLGLLIGLLGLWFSEVAGWRTADVALAPGDSSALAQARGLRIRLERLTGPEQAVVAEVTLTPAEDQPQQMSLGPLPVARQGNLWLYLRAIGPALAVTARDSGDRPLALQALATGGETGPELHLLFRQDQSEQGFGLPGRNLTFRAVSYASLPDKGIDRSVFLVEAYRGDATTPALSQLIEDEAETTVDDVILSLRRDRYALLGMAYLPGLPGVAAGGFLALAGALIVLVCQFRLTSSRLSPTMKASGD